MKSLMLVTLLALSIVTAHAKEKEPEVKPPTELEKAQTDLKACHGTLAQVRVLFSKESADKAQMAHQLDIMLQGAQK